MKRTIGIMAVTLVATLFYASVWTSEYPLSTCFALSGVILGLQSWATVMVIEFT